MSVKVWSNFNLTAIPNFHICPNCRKQTLFVSAVPYSPSVLENHARRGLELGTKLVRCTFCFYTPADYQEKKVTNIKVSPEQQLLFF